MPCHQSGFNEFIRFEYRKLGLKANVSEIISPKRSMQSRIEAEAIRNNIVTTPKKKSRRLSNFADRVGEVEYPEGTNPLCLLFSLAVTSTIIFVHSLAVLVAKIWTFISCVVIISKVVQLKMCS